MIICLPEAAFLSSLFSAMFSKKGNLLRSCQRQKERKREEKRREEKRREEKRSEEKRREEAMEAKNKSQELLGGKFIFKQALASPLTLNQWGLNCFALLN